MTPYWHKQTADKSLFPDIEWNKPEQRSQAGRLGIIGGNKLGFFGVAESYTCALNAGAGAVRALLPDALKKNIPRAVTEAIFTTSTVSGGISKDAISDMKALGGWSTGILLIGDNGKNSETAIGLEHFVRTYNNAPLIITRDAVDSLMSSSSDLLQRASTTYVVSFAQLQTIFRTIYYPKMLTFQMQLAQTVEILHKFTITYPATIVTFHQNYLLLARGGTVVTQEWDYPMAIWKGTLAAYIATYTLWNPTQPLEASVEAIRHIPHQ